MLDLPHDLPGDIGIFLIFEGSALIWIKAAPMIFGQIQSGNHQEHLTMADTLTARFLDRRTIDQAFPLVRNIVPGMTAARWARFVRPRLMPRSPDWPRGVMTVQNDGGCILSLFAFEVRADLHESRIFYMDHIMVPNLPGRGTLWASTIGAAERLAEMNGCRAIRAEFGDGSEHSDEDILTALESMGYLLSGVRAFKRLEANSGRASDDSDGLVHSPQGLSDA